MKNSQKSKNVAAVAENYLFLTVTGEFSKQFLNFESEMRKYFEIIGKYCLFLKRVFARPEKWRLFFRQFLIESDKLVVSSVLLVAFISVFIGGVIVIQTAANLENPFVAKLYVGYMTRESLILEFCSTMIALVLAGKIGSNVSSELGSMRITEQIDAMEMMGVNSANYLVLPKIASATLLSPLLTLISFIVGLAGGALVAYTSDMVTITDYMEGITFSFNGSYVVYSCVKTAVFSFLITSISAFNGYYASGGSLGVGRSSTKAIVYSSMLILVFDLLLTQTMLY